jgi:hypothetical protein
MSAAIEARLFVQQVLEILDEAFVAHHGIFLDKNTSLFETLDGITAEQASIPVGGKCATLAAQVAHVTFYLEVIEGYIQHKDLGTVDWGEIWRRVHGVSAAEWSTYRDQLRAAHQRVIALLEGVQDWNAERPLGGALAVLAHTAYHLGEIRQAMCTLKPA